MFKDILSNGKDFDHMWRIQVFIALLLLEPYTNSVARGFPNALSRYSL
jgi:hypothetical protein